MKLFAHLLGLMVVLGSLTAEEIPEPYASTNDLPFDGHGWFMNGDYIAATMSLYNPVIAIEVGAWLGSSTRFIAERLPAGGKLYAIDTWRGSPNEPLHLRDPRMPYLYQLFLSNVKHANLTNVIIPVRMESLEASKAMNVQADFIYIDASHDETNVYNDILAWYPHVKEGGVMCGDDWGWVSVQRGVIRAANHLGKTVWGHGNFWRFL
ncbi:MAG: class I SAM-dependent methyltransferase [Parachlamydiales bacterium]